MVVLSYTWSRKHYPIPYKTGKILFYMGLALGIFFLNRLFLQDVESLRNLWNLLLLAFFAGTVYFRERDTLKSYQS
jgi:hypothetical protein